MKNTFISYASADLPIVEKICAHLEMRGIDCWMAPRDIMPGRDYAEEIIGGIEGAATTLLLLSEHSNQSMFVKREIERAVSKSKPVIPVRIQSVMPSASLEFFVSSAHWIDVWQEPIEPKMDLLASAIRGLTGGGSHKNKKFVSADDGEPCPPRDLSATHDVPPVALAWDSGNKDATRDDAIDSQRDDQRKRIKGQVFSPLKWSIVVAGILLFIVGYALLDDFPGSMDSASNPSVAAKPPEADSVSASRENRTPQQSVGEARTPDRVDVEPSNDPARTTAAAHAESSAAHKTAEPNRREVVVPELNAGTVSDKVPPTQAVWSDAKCKAILSKVSLGVDQLAPDESNYLQSHCR
jgi:hypothetical protein